MQSADDKVIEYIRRSRRGKVYFSDSFLNIADAKTISKALERLVLSGELHRVAAGMYVRPVKDSVLGILLPDIEDIALAIARRDRARVVPTGSFALYKLGLTTQVPMNIVFHTDGSARRVTVGNRNVTFKKSSARNVSAIGELSKLVIQALRTIGKDNVTEEEIRIIRERLKDEKPYHLKHDIKLAPEWVRKLMRPAL